MYIKKNIINSKRKTDIGRVSYISELLKMKRMG